MQRLRIYSVLCFALLALLLPFFGDVFLHPNSYFLSGDSDAAKTYFTTEYFIRHDSGNEFSGYGYPHGVNVVFAENPAMLLLLRALARMGVDTATHAVGIINFSILISFFPCAIFLYEILRKSLLPRNWAIFFALAITAGSPQVMRITGHLALSYLFFVPMIWWLLLRIAERQRLWLWGILLAAAIGIFSFIHLYYFLIAAAFILAWILAHILQYKKRFFQYKNIYITLLAACFLPIVLIRGWMSGIAVGATDSVKYPYGFTGYRASFQSVFLPNEWTPQYRWLNAIINTANASWEGYGYVGVVGLVMLIVGIAYIIRQIRQKKFRKIGHLPLPEGLQTAVWAGVLVLLLAMCLPFRWYEPMSYWVAELRQFRSLGRVVWVFYYIFMVMTAHYAYAHYRVWRRKPNSFRSRWAIALPLLAGCLWLTEAATILHKSGDIIATKGKARLRIWRSPLLAQASIQPADYQAILALPFSHVGSEKVGIQGVDAVNFYAIAVANQLGLPLLDCASSRTPLTYTWQSMQLTSHPFIRKMLIDSLPNRRPLLLLWRDDSLVQAEQPLVAQERLLIARAKPLWSNGVWHLAALSLSAFEDTTGREIFKQVKQHGVQQAGLWLSAPSPLVFAEGYGDALSRSGQSPRTLILNANLHQRSKKQRILFEKNIISTQIDTTLEFSVWVKMDVEDNYLPNIVVAQYAGSQHLAEFDARCDMERGRDAIDHWLRGAVEFRLQPQTTRIQVITQDRNFTFDNALLRPTNVEVAAETPDGQPLLNNFPLH